jgi:pyrroloquinoline quinone (PQQ) biosynthesis protein C
MSHPSYVRGNSFVRTPYPHLPLDVAKNVKQLKDEVFSHPAVDVLKEFGDNLRERPLTKDELRVLLASEGMFVLDVPPGILNLASRITDEWFERNPFAATGGAARVLFAAVDEYGLCDMSNGLLPSHHQLYLEMAQHWGITAAELLDDKNIVSTGHEFSRTIREYYRNKPIIEALGFHVANETTAPLDFGVFLAAFKEFHKEYGFKSENDPHLNFLLVHDDVEVSHREMGVEMVQLYTNGRPELVERARRGVLAYMDCYGKFFGELNERMFGAQVKRKVRVGR